MKNDRTMKSMTRFLFVVLTSSLLLNTTALTAKQKGLLELALHNANERDGDYDAFATELLEAIPSFKDDGRVELLAHRLRTCVSSMRNPRALIGGLEKTLGDALPGDTRWLLSRLLSDLYQRAGQADAARELSANLGYLTRFLVIGPFGKDMNGPLPRAFPPEKNIDLTRGYKDGWQELRWRPVKRKEPHALLDPFKHVYPNNGIPYLLCQVHSAVSRNAVLNVLAGAEIKIWCNGVLAIDDTSRNEHLSVHRRTGIRLEKGWNRILVKANTRLLLRLTDPNGTPFGQKALAEEAELKLHPLPAKAAGTWEGPYSEAAEKAWSQRLAALTGKPLAMALEHSGLAILHKANSRNDLAVAEAAKAIELAPDDPWVLHHGAAVFQAASYLPAAQSKNRARDAWQKVSTIDEAFLPAQTGLATILQQDQKNDDAAARLRDVVEKHPEFLAGLKKLQLVYAGLGWETEEKQVLGKIRKLAPASPTPWMVDAARYRKRENPRKALEYYNQAYSRDRSGSSLLSTMSELNSQLGNKKKAFELLNQSHQSALDNHSIAESIALRMIKDKGSSAKDAISWYSAAVGPRDWSPAHKKALARIYSAADERESELAMYRESLALAPGDLKTRKFLKEREAEDNRFWAPYDENLEEWLPRVPANGPLVEKAQALSILDISVVRVYQDGSSSEYIHQAFKLLSEEAKDQVAKVRTSGEILKLRTLTAEGESLEPVAALSGGNYVMPGMLPGAHTEFAYVVDKSNARGVHYRHGPFFFQDFNYKQSFLLSRLVYILPPGLDSDIVTTAFDQASDTNGIVKVLRSDKTLEDGTRVITFESNNAGRIQSERAMPHYTGYVPSAQMRPKKTWKDIERALRGFSRQATALTPELRATAAEVTGKLTDPLEKARAIYDHVNKVVTKDTGSSIAIRVLMEKSGNRTFLFKALLDAAGIPSSWAFLRMDENLERKTDWDYPSNTYFRAPHVLLEPTGKQPFYISLQYRDLPFGFLPEFFSKGKALVLDQADSRIVDLPSIPAEVYESATRATWKLGEDVAVNVNFVMETKAAQGWMQKDRFSNLNAFQMTLMTSGLATQLFPGAKVEKGGFVGINDKAQPFALEFELEAPKLMVRSGEDFLLPPVLQPAQLVRSYGAPPTRKHPYEVRQRRAKQDKILVHLGENFEVSKLPSNVSLTGQRANYSLTYKQEAGTLSIERKLTIEPGSIAPARFPQFLDLLQKADAAEKERIVLRSRKPAEE